MTPRFPSESRTCFHSRLRDREPQSEEVAGFSTFQPAPHGVEHLEMRVRSVPAESHPVGDVNSPADGSYFDGEVAQAEESPAEDHPPQSFLEQLSGAICGKSCGKVITRLDADEFRSRGDVLEVVEVERAPHRVNRHQALLPLRPILDGYAEQLKRHVHCGD